MGDLLGIQPKTPRGGVKHSSQDGLTDGSLDSSLPSFLPKNLNDIKLILARWIKIEEYPCLDFVFY
jgi:hypothetical protein